MKLVPRSFGWVIVLIIAYPLVVFFRALSSRKPLARRALRSVWALLVLVPLWAGFYTACVFFILLSFHLRPVAIPISGTGSMYPTFPKGTTATPQEQSKEVVARPMMFPYPNGLTIF